MIFADKLIQLRKKSGWSQEELASQMHVSRQSVSKWEGAQSVPDLEKIVRLAELFEVSTDYLLKDDMEDAKLIHSESDPNRHSISLEQANEYLSIVESTHTSTAYATSLCILSPVCLLLLSGLSELKPAPISENVAAGAGLIILVSMVAIAVSIFISNANKAHAYQFLEKEDFDLQYGVSGMVKDRQEKFRAVYNKYNTMGVVLCILAAIPIFVFLMIDENNDMISMIGVCILLAMVALSVYFFVNVGCIWGSYEKLLQIGDYTKEKKNNSWLSSVYWLVVVAIFLGYSFITNNWEYSWIIFAVAGVLYPALMALYHVFQKKNQ